MIKVLVNRTEIDLREIHLGSRVAILMGTFDPIHMGHVEIANQSLKRNLGESGVDLVLFYLHSHSKTKNPSPHADRFKILKGFLSDQKDLGILILNESDLAEFIESNSLSSTLSWVKVLFNYLFDYHPVSYARILGADRIAKAVEEHLGISHYVSPRENISILPLNNFFPLPEPRLHLSSTFLRNGEIPLSEKYLPFFKVIERIYPKAKFMTQERL